jgi:hypothetical protein
MRSFTTLPAVTGRFSGRPTTDRGALDVVLADAHSVRITPNGALVYAVDPEADVLDPDVPKTVSIMSDEVLAHVQDVSAVRKLREALAVESFENYVCMCPGQLALEFLDAHGDRLTVVRIDSPGTVDWPLWAGKALVRDQTALREWLRDHDADGPLVHLEALQAKWDRDRA